MQGIETDMSQILTVHGNAVAESFFSNPEVKAYHNEALLNAKYNEVGNFLVA